MRLPILGSYMVGERFLAGEYPGAPDPRSAERRLRAFAEYGVTTFVDLTHPADGLAPYEHLLGPGARRLSHPIVDFGTTTIPHLTRILDDVDAALADHSSVYVHCWGGVGRTGMVVGCWLVRHRLDEGDPLRTVARLRRGTPDAWAASPQTPAQRAIVTAWKRGN
jgi:Polymorphic toxin system, DSP-PTPase phosphatase